MDFGLATAKGREQRRRIGTNEDHEWTRMNANKKVVARSWSAASLARPTAVGAMGLNVHRSGQDRGDTIHLGTHPFSIHARCRTHIKSWVATPVGLASEAALHGWRLLFSFAFVRVHSRLLPPIIDKA